MYILLFIDNFNRNIWTYNIGYNSNEYCAYNKDVLNNNMQVLQFSSPVFFLILHIIKKTADIAAGNMINH